MSFEARPQGPRSDLLDQARTDLERRLDVDLSDTAWDVVERMERKRSTLFPLTLTSPAGEVKATAYYKAPYFPPEKQGSRNLDRAREAVARARTLGDRFAELARGTEIEINVTLAADLSTLETVTLGLEGRPMGSPLLLIAPPNRRRHALEACRNVGRAVRLMERLALDDEHPIGEMSQSSERKLDSATSFLAPDEIQRLDSLLGDLHEAARRHGFTVAHGDLSPGNVILMDDGTGLIDFLWMNRVKGFDLSRFVHRLRHSTATFRPWTESLVDAALGGYGDRSVTDTPGWRFSELMHLLTTLRLLDRRGRAGGRAGRRALAELRKTLDEYSEYGRNRQ